jgi:hypothetical protein
MKFTSNYVNVIIDEDPDRAGPLSETQLVVCTGNQQDVWEEHFSVRRVRRIGARTIELTDLIDAAIAAGVVIEDLYDPPAHRGTFIETEFMEASSLLEAKATEERMKKAASWDREMLDDNTD